MQGQQAEGGLDALLKAGLELCVDVELPGAQRRYIKEQPVGLRGGWGWGSWVGCRTHCELYGIPQYPGEGLPPVRRWGYFLWFVVVHRFSPLFVVLRHKKANVWHSPGPELGTRMIRSCTRPIQHQSAMCGSG